MNFLLGAFSYFVFALIFFFYINDFFGCTLADLLIILFT